MADEYSPIPRGMRGASTRTHGESCACHAHRLSPGEIHGWIHDWRDDWIERAMTGQARPCSNTGRTPCHPWRVWLHWAPHAVCSHEGAVACARAPLTRQTLTMLAPLYPGEIHDWIHDWWSDWIELAMTGQARLCACTWSSPSCPGYCGTMGHHAQPGPTRAAGHALALRAPRSCRVPCLAA